DERFLKAVNYKYAVFPSSPCEIEKRKDTFVVTSKEAKEIDFRLVGIRAGEENTFWIYSEDDVA
ncbi:hypothetical protein, partial [Alkalihalophilus marmarensis]|uniref:hypothetical protein n=1 Tax=Alkalihalophilus marmarensis TaxID=521377 RepID=UPI002E21D333|nr:hypothetical protein [Alkalihalophilus marmarensis]